MQAIRNVEVAFKCNTQYSVSYQELRAKCEIVDDDEHLQRVSLRIAREVLPLSVSQRGLLGQSEVGCHAEVEYPRAVEVGAKYVVIGRVHFDVVDHDVQLVVVRQRGHSLGVFTHTGAGILVQSREVIARGTIVDTFAC